MSILSRTGSLLMTVSGVRFMLWSAASTKKTSQKLLIEPAKSVWRSVFWWKQHEIQQETFEAAVERSACRRKLSGAGEA